MFKNQDSELDSSSHDPQKTQTSLQHKALLHSSLTTKYFYCSGECVLGSIGGVLCSVGSLFLQRIILLTIVYDEWFLKYVEKFQALF